MLVRNHGCRWGFFQWNGLNTIIMENDILRIEILVDKGTDIVEFLYKPKDIDFMWRGPMPFHNFPKMIATTPGKLGSFLDYYPGGWQEVFPNGGIPCEYKGAVLGLHGEVALLPWKFNVLEDTPDKISIEFEIKTTRTPFTLRKTLRLEKSIPTLFIEEEVINEANESMDFMWGHHPAFGKPFLSPDCHINIAGGEISVGKGDGRAFSNLKIGEGKWPFAKGKDETLIDISKCPGENDRVADIIFLSRLKEGKYQIINDLLKTGFEMKFPLNIFKCIWFWRVAGGSFDYPWYGRTYNIALEPFSSLPNLAEAIKRGDQLTLNAGKNLKANISASVISL